MWQIFNDQMPLLTPTQYCDGDQHFLLRRHFKLIVDHGWTVSPLPMRWRLYLAIHQTSVSRDIRGKSNTQNAAPTLSKLPGECIETETKQSVFSLEINIFEYCHKSSLTHLYIYRSACLSFCQFIYLYHTIHQTSVLRDVRGKSKCFGRTSKNLKMH